MRTWRAARVTCAIALLVGGLAGLARAQPAGNMPVIFLDGVVDAFNADYLTREIAAANDEGAPALLLEIDTPGGLASEMEEISQAILTSDVPVLGYVTPSGARAASAGSVILLSAPVAAMAPGTHVGAATPVGLDGGDLSTKVVNDAAADMRALAQTYDRNADVAESFVTDGVSITAEEALADGVIELIASDRAGLIAQVDGTTISLGDGTEVALELPATVSFEERPMGGFFGFLHALFDPNLAFVFFWLGLILIVLELIIPGHVFSGTVGTIMLLLSLWSFGLLPVRWIGIALLIGSVIAFVIELKAPGIGIWGLVGVVLLVLGGWFLYDRSGGVSVSPWVIVVTALMAAGFFGFVVAKALAMRKLPPVQGGRSMIGRTGVAIASGVTESGGLVRVDAEEWQAVSPSGEIPTGAQVRVSKVVGLVMTVEPVTEEAADPEAAGRS